MGLLAGFALAVCTVAGAWVLRGQVARESSALPSAPVAIDAAAAEPAPRVVYVRPAPSPQVIQVTQTASAPPPPVIQQIVPGHGDDDGGRDDD